MTAILERRESKSLWGRFCNWITRTENCLYIGWFGVLMIPNLLTTTSVFIITFIATPTVDIDGIHEFFFWISTVWNNIISGAIIPTSVAIGLHLLHLRFIISISFGLISYFLISAYRFMPSLFFSFLYLFMNEFRIFSYLGFTIQHLSL